MYENDSSDIDSALPFQLLSENFHTTLSTLPDEQSLHRRRLRLPNGLRGLVLPSPSNPLVFERGPYSVEVCSKGAKCISNLKFDDIEEFFGCETLVWVFSSINTYSKPYSQTRD